MPQARERFHQEMPNLGEFLQGLHARVGYAFPRHLVNQFLLGHLRGPFRRCRYKQTCIDR